MRSDKIKKGIPAAPQRALLHALGVTDKELEKVQYWSDLSKGSGIIEQ